MARTGSEQSTGSGNAGEPRELFRDTLAGQLFSLSAVHENYETAFLKAAQFARSGQYGSTLRILSNILQEDEVTDGSQNMWMHVKSTVEAIGSVYSIDINEYIPDRIKVLEEQAALRTTFLNQGERDLLNLIGEYDGGGQIPTTLFFGKRDDVPVNDTLPNESDISRAPKELQYIRDTKDSTTERIHKLLHRQF
tara:strand:+ start:1125 stop:1706 length:582 start_codon:yes stop_codon:yes gene_type:complete